MKKVQNHVLIILSIILLSSVLLTTAGVYTYKMEQFGQKIFLPIIKWKPHDNKVFSVLPLASLLLLLRRSAEGVAAHEISSQLFFATAPADEIKARYLELVNKYDSNQNVSTLNNIYIQHDYTNTVDINLNTLNTIQSWDNMSICHIANDVNIIFPRVQISLKTEIHFNNMFYYKFSGTRIQPFQTSKSKKIKKVMVTLVGNIRTGDISVLKAKAYEVPYSLGNTSLVFLLPYTFKAMKHLDKRLGHVPFSAVDMRLRPEVIKLEFPLIKFEMENDIKDELENNMDIKGMFYRLCDDFKNILVIKWTYIAAFATKSKNAGHEPDTGNQPVDKLQKITINRPFYFFIKSQENDIYAVGKING